MKRWKDHVQNPRRLRAMALRAQIENETRQFFLGHGFLETRTPLLVPCPGMEPHIRPFQVSGHGRKLSTSVFLPTSPEFAMKRLLAGGLEKIFQISPAFRDEPKSTTHHPEFTMLEWYRAHSKMEKLMEDVEGLFLQIASSLGNPEKICYQGQNIDLKGPWPRKKTRDLFLEYLNIDIGKPDSPSEMKKICLKHSISLTKNDTWDDLYFKLWLNLIEPKLPADRPTFVTHYPASQAALSEIETHADGTRWARRFEVYLGGIELANAFQELTDPVEQKRRFVSDMDLREKIYGSDFPKTPIDQGFLEALTEGMPPSSGIALGLDRAIMLFADETDIDFTFWLPATN